MSWQEHGSCQDHPEIDWIPTFDRRGARPLSDRENIAAAKAVCAACPVQSECLEDALAHPDTAGVWGGTTATERRKMPRARLRAAVAQCGTDSGYYHHLRQTMTEPCDACRFAHSQSVARREWLRRA